MKNIGIFLPTIEGIGGVERVAYILARDLGVKIYTTKARKDLDVHFPGMSSYIINISKHPDNPSLFTMIRDFRSFQEPIDLMIYRYPRSIYLTAIRKDIPYLFYMGGIPHHFYLSSDYYKRYLGNPSIMKYMDKIVWKDFLKKLDNQRIIANSRNTADIYQQMFGKAPMDIIYPPVDTNQYKCRPSEDYYLSVTRFEKYKRIELQIEAFKGTKEKLIIIGNGPLFKDYYNYLKDNNIDNITLIEAPGKDKLIEYYSRCKGFIFTSFREHFGATPIEALASGKPVISVREGGPLEYLEEGVNGFFFDTVSGLRQKVSTLSIEELESMKDDCIRTSKQFDTSNFIKKFSNLLKEYNCL